MSRSGGCPFNIKNAAVEMMDNATGLFVRVKGLTKLTVEASAKLGDGSPADALWTESFIQSRSVKGKLEGKPIADRVSGARDPGQQLLHSAAYDEGGCINDHTLRIADAVGHATRFDCVITGESYEPDEDGESISWDWESVGAPEEEAYIQAQSLCFTDTAATPAVITSLNLSLGQSTACRVRFTPETSSNRRFAWSVADGTKLRVASAEDEELTLQGLQTGTTTLTVRSMNNNLTAVLNVTIA